MKAGVGPVFPEPLVETSDIDKLDANVDVKTKLSYVYEAITLTRHRLEGKVPLIGFSGAPWTLMGYMIEGGGSKTMSKAKKWLYKEPDASHKLLSLLTKIIIAYLIEQVNYRFIIYIITLIGMFDNKNSVKLCILGGGRATSIGKTNS